MKQSQEPRRWEADTPGKNYVVALQTSPGKVTVVLHLSPQDSGLQHKLRAMTRAPAIHPNVLRAPLGQSLLWAGLSCTGFSLYSRSQH